jgi:ribosome-associated protein
MSVDLEIPAHELEFSFSRSSGPGGQNVNKVNSKALLRWKPSENRSLPEAVRQRFLARYGSRLTKEGELLLTSEESRNQKTNQEICLTKLKRMIQEVARPPKVRKPTKPTKGSERRRQETKRRTGEKKRTRSKSNWE